MPFSTGTFRTWPIARGDLEPHYRAILRHIPYAGEADDLEETFPLLGHPRRLPEVSDRTASVLRRYGRRRMAVRQHGVTVGAARLALNASACRRCGLCMTGCPYELIYSASQTFDELRARGRVDYRPGVHVHHIEEDSAGRVDIRATDLTSGEPLVVSADRCISRRAQWERPGSSRLHSVSPAVHHHGGIRAVHDAVLLGEAGGSVTQAGEFTLNQFNLFVTFDADGKDASFVHCYPYNDIMLSSLPRFMDARPFTAAARSALRHLTVGLGYLPSWASPAVDIHIGRAKEAGHLPDVHVSSRENEATQPMLQRVFATDGSGRALDLHPDTGANQAFGRSQELPLWRFVPNAAKEADGFASDLLGRVAPWRNVHLVDASVFPTVPATTFTLTIMANAHRIATGSMRQSRRAARVASPAQQATWDRCCRTISHVGETK